MEKAQLDEQVAWDVFYHGRISVDEVINQLRAHLEPTEVEIAETAFAETILAPPDAPGGLSKEIFHQRLISSLMRLAAGRSVVPLKHIASLAARFPEKTETLCRYLESVRDAEGAAVVAQIEDLLNSNVFSTPWQLAWLIRTLGPGMQFAKDNTIQVLSNLAEAETAHWIVRVEAMKALASAGQLQQLMVTKAWKLAPRVYRPDLLAAVGRLSDDWAKRFVSVGHLDPIERVVIAHLTARQSEGAG